MVSLTSSHSRVSHFKNISNGGIEKKSVCRSIMIKTYILLYPTQRVAEGIMFLTRPSVSQSVSQSVSPVFLVSATPLKPVSYTHLTLPTICSV